MISKKKNNHNKRILGTSITENMRVCPMQNQALMSKHSKTKLNSRKTKAQKQKIKLGISLFDDPIHYQLPRSSTSYLSPSKNKIKFTSQETNNNKHSVYKSKNKNIILAQSNINHSFNQDCRLITQEKSKNKLTDISNLKESMFNLNKKFDKLKEHQNKQNQKKVFDCFTQLTINNQKKLQNQLHQLSKQHSLLLNKYDQLKHQAQLHIKLKAQIKQYKTKYDQIVRLKQIQQTNMQQQADIIKQQTQNLYQLNQNIKCLEAEIQSLKQEKFSSKQQLSCTFSDLKIDSNSLQQIKTKCQELYQLAQTQRTVWEKSKNKAQITEKKQLEEIQNFKSVVQQYKKINEYLKNNIQEKVEEVKLQLNNEMKSLTKSLQIEKDKVTKMLKEKIEDENEIKHCKHMLNYNVSEHSKQIKRNADKTEVIIQSYQRKVQSLEKQVQHKNQQIQNNLTKLQRMLQREQKINAQKQQMLAQISNHQSILVAKQKIINTAEQQLIRNRQLIETLQKDKLKVDKQSTISQIKINQQLQRKQQKLKLTQMKVNSLQNQIDSLQSCLQNYQQDLLKIKKQLQDQQKFNKSLKIENNQKEIKIKSMTETIEGMKDYSCEREEQLTEKIIYYRQKYEEMAINNKQITNNSQKLQYQLEKKTQCVQKFQKQKKGLYQQVITYEQRSKEQTTSIIGLQTALSQIKMTLEDTQSRHKEEIITVELKLKEEQNKYKQQYQLMNDRDKKITTLSGEIQKIQLEARSIRNEIHKKQNQISALELQKDILNQKNLSYQDMISNQQAAISQYKSRETEQNKTKQKQLNEIYQLCEKNKHQIIQTLRDKIQQLVSQVEQTHEQTKQQLEKIADRDKKIEEMNTLMDKNHELLLKEKKQRQMQEKKYKQMYNKNQNRLIKNNECLEQQYKQISIKYMQLNRDHSKIKVQMDALKTNCKVLETQNSNIQLVMAQQIGHRKKIIEQLMMEKKMLYEQLSTK